MLGDAELSEVEVASVDTDELTTDVLWLEAGDVLRLDVVVEEAAGDTEELPIDVFVSVDDSDGAVVGDWVGIVGVGVVGVVAGDVFFGVVGLCELVLLLDAVLVAYSVVIVAVAGPVVVDEVAVVEKVP